jgi:hypothetical protein
VSKVDDTEALVGLALVGVAIWVAYEIYQGIKGIGSGVASAASAATTAAQNFDANVGLAPFDNAVSSLFDPPAGT